MLGATLVSKFSPEAHRHNNGKIKISLSYTSLLWFRCYFQSHYGMNFYYMGSFLINGNLSKKFESNGPKVQKCDFSISRRFRLTEAIRNDAHGLLYVFSTSHISFYQIVKKNQWDLRRPCWKHHRGSKIYHLKVGGLKQHFSLFYGSGTFIWSNDPNLIGYQGHIDNCKVTRKKTGKIHFGMDLFILKTLVMDV